MRARWSRAQGGESGARGVEADGGRDPARVDGEREGAGRDGSDADALELRPGERLERCRDLARALGAITAPRQAAQRTQRRLLAPRAVDGADAPALQTELEHRFGEPELVLADLAAVDR